MRVCFSVNTMCLFSYVCSDNGRNIMDNKSGNCVMFGRWVVKTGGVGVERVIRVARRVCEFRVICACWRNPYLIICSVRFVSSFRACTH